MSNTLTFYSIGRAQIDYVFRKLGVSHDANGLVSGETPLGKLIVRTAYAEGSGQFTVEVVQKPFLLTMATIEHQIRTALENAGDAITELTQLAQAASETPVAAAGTQEKKVSNRKASGADSKSSGEIPPSK
jgi:hypothetical protein